MDTFPLKTTQSQLLLHSSLSSTVTSSERAFLIIPIRNSSPLFPTGVSFYPQACFTFPS